MPYASRDLEGVLTSLHRQPGPDHEEFLPDDHPEVRQFLGAVETTEQRFARLDADFVRVLEDLIDTLIAKHLINITDLPGEAQAKLFSRKTFREHTSQYALQLFGADDVRALIDAERSGQVAPPSVSFE